MKIYKVIIISLICIMILCSCTSQELQNLQVEVNLENIKVEKIANVFDANKEQADKFNEDFEYYVLNLDKDSTEIDKYINFDRKLSDTIAYLPNMLDADEGAIITSVSSYPFLEEETGNILDYVYVNATNRTLEFVFTFEDGKIVNYNFDYIK